MAKADVNMLVALKTTEVRYSFVGCTTAFVPDSKKVELVEFVEGVERILEDGIVLTDYVNKTEGRGW